MNKLFLEQSNAKQMAAPVDFNLAAVTGSRIKLEHGYSCVVVLSFGDSTGATVTVDFDQHDAAAAGNSKALNVQANYYYKNDTDTAFTRVQVRPDDSVLSDSVDLAALGFNNAEGIAVFEFKAEHLDVENGYYWLSANLAAAGAAKIVGGVYIIDDSKHVAAYSQDL